LYELRALIDTYETADLDALDEMPEGQCLDCARHLPRVRYGNVAVCVECARARIRIRNAMRVDSRRSV